MAPIRRSHGGQGSLSLRTAAPGGPGEDQSDRQSVACSAAPGQVSGLLASLTPSCPHLQREHEAYSSRYRLPCVKFSLPPQMGVTNDSLPRTTRQHREAEAPSLTGLHLDASFTSPTQSLPLVSAPIHPSSGTKGSMQKIYCVHPDSSSDLGASAV